MSDPSKPLAEFVSYVKSLVGDEKGEAQVFCDRLFQAFGHRGYKEAGATLEYRLHEKGHRVKFADLLWKPRLLLEMKTRGENLQRHYSQAFGYWERAVPNRPRYVVLCNFDEFWIYDFDWQLDEPVDRVQLNDLPERYPALNFLFPEDKKPQFGNDRIAVTRAAADKVAAVFNSLVKRGEERNCAQRFVLQCVVAMFSEDFGLLPKGLFTELLDECVAGKSSYDLLGALFRQMNSPKRAGGGRYKDVAYFNGGIFSVIEPLELKHKDLEILREAASENWGKIQPAIFGTLFQSSLDQKARHAYGAHFTSEAEIQKVVIPTIVLPWRKRIQTAETLNDFIKMRKDILDYRVLDPACGSGNFIYIAYRELLRLEMEILLTGFERFGEKGLKKLGAVSHVRTTQFYGIDNNAFAVELARVTLALARQLGLAEVRVMASSLPLQLEQALPLDNLDQNIRCDDALFCNWPKVQAIIGNPPYQSKNKMQQEYGREYLNRLHDRYPRVPGHADYCVYWFRRSHDELPPSGRAGLVGTNTIRQTYSREGGLDYILENSGTITEAVSTQVWPGEAVVHVSIVNWLKGREIGKKRLFFQKGDHKESPWEVIELDLINSSLSSTVDVSSASALEINKKSKACYQGQTHGHEGFLLTMKEGASSIERSPQNADVLFPFLTGDEMLSTAPPAPQRFVIDFAPHDVTEAAKYADLFARVKKLVLPDRETAAKEEQVRNDAARKLNSEARVNVHHENFLKRWWLLSYPRPEMMAVLAEMPRYIVCAQVTRRPIFEFVDSKIHPNAALLVFPLPDDYSFGILQSNIHWAWFVARCSTLKGDFRYTSNSVFDSFPWPQSPSASQVKAVAGAAVDVRKLRRSIMEKNGWCLREVYRTLELPGENPLKEAHAALDRAVRSAFAMPEKDDPLRYLLELNKQLAKREGAGQSLVGPGLPPSVRDPRQLITSDCVGLTETAP